MPESKPKKKMILRHKRYVGEISTDDFSTPRKAKYHWRIAKKKVMEQKRKISNLHQRNRRLKAKVKCLGSLLQHLKEKNYISDSAEMIIGKTLPGSAGEIMKNVLKGPTRQKYTPALRAFALTLNFYSPKAYRYIREKFNKSLPHPSTIAKWYQCVDGSPGFTKEAIEALKIKVKEASLKKKKLICNLVMDEMAIRKQVEWTGKKFTGYIDIGSNFCSDQVPEATEALVFMLVAVNDHWKIPVGYYLIHGLSGQEKSNLVNSCLEFIHESGVIVSSLTFDGAAANLTMARCLGANFTNVENLTTYFPHPVTGQNDIFFDPCHMLKLIRNCFGSFQLLENAEGKGIKWRYLHDLVELQNIEGLHAATKMKRRHLQWTREKMKVKIACQTLSRSVSDALLYLCHDLQLPEFRNVDATADFVRKCNDLFDIFNSRNRFGKYLYKRPVSPKTKLRFFEYLEQLKKYILNLQLAGELVVESGRRTGFVGFLICIDSLMAIYSQYVECEEPLLKFLLTYKFSQDHLEIFFSSIRSCGGHNNNPTARQFESIYRKLLVHTEVKGADTSNVTTLDDTSILQCSSRSKKITLNEDNEDLLESENHAKIWSEIEDHDYLGSQAWHLTVYVEDIVKYIAGFVVKSVKNSIACIKCIHLLESPETHSDLQKRKQYGKLCNASLLVIETCKSAERSFRYFQVSENLFKKRDNLINTLIVQTKRNFPLKIMDHFGDHIFDDDILGGHNTQLINLILRTYFKIRIHHETIKKLDKDNIRVRSILTESILFKNQ